MKRFLFLLFLKLILVFLHLLAQHILLCFIGSINPPGLASGFVCHGFQFWCRCCRATEADGFFREIRRIFLHDFFGFFNSTAGASGFSTTDFTVNDLGTTITVKVPAFATASLGQIQVQAAGGNGFSQEFRINTPAAPIVNSLSVNSGVAGTNFQINGSTLGSTTGVTVAGNPVTKFTILNGNTIQAVIPQLAPGTYAVVVNTGGGASAPMMFTITPSPVPVMWM